MESEIKPGLYHTPAGSIFNVHENGRDYGADFDWVEEDEACCDCDTGTFEFGIGVDNNPYVDWDCLYCHLEHNAELHPGPKKDCKSCS